MTKPNNNKNHVFQNSDSVVFYYRSTREQTEPKIFQFCLEAVSCTHVNHFFAVCWSISSHERKEIKVAYDNRNVVARFCHNMAEQLLTLYRLGTLDKVFADSVLLYLNI